MLPIAFGNWLVTDDGIKWTGEGGGGYFIERGSLLETTTRDGARMYDWLIHMPSKAWVKELDLYTLNTAFIFALDYFDLNLKAASLAKTLHYQQEEFKDRDID